MNTTLLAVLATAIAGPLFAYIVAARRLSGRIGTSDASELWKESAAMRAEYRAQIASLNDLVGHLRERLAILEKTNADLRNETSELKRQLAVP